MAGYSGTPLSKKLGIKEGFRIFVQNPPDGYEGLLQPLPENIVFLNKSTDDVDMIHFFTKSGNELSDNIADYARMIKQDGMIWVSWPKKSAKVETDITEDVIRSIILPMGLVDVKVCAVDEIWSGLKLVIRKENRKK